MALKNEIIKILEKYNNTFISGQSLANQLSVSRTAIWKAINSLKNEGYNIISVSNKGYKLSNTNDKIFKEGIINYLDNKYKDIEIEVFDEIDSTNDEAKRRIANKTFPTVIVSDTQLKGRGRYGKSFYSPSKSGVYMTIILTPNMQLNNAKLITCSTAVCVCKAIEKLTNQNPKIKWVNDILINNRKVCGILTEAITDFEAGCVEKILIGIGINCNSNISDYPKELENKIGYIELLPKSRNNLIAFIINTIMSEIFNSPKQIINEYKSRSMMINKEIIYQKNNKELLAKVVDINDDGNLIVVDENNNKFTINSGVVEIKGLYD